MDIGSFHFDGEIYAGRLRTLTLDVPLRVVPVPKGDAERAPDWRVHLDDPSGVEVGSGWTHDRDGGGTFVALQLDCPTLARPLRANLLLSRNPRDGHVLLWSRQGRRARES